MPACGDHHALGPAGRARGVDHVGRARSGPGRRRTGWRAGPRRVRAPVDRTGGSPAASGRPASAATRTRRRRPRACSAMPLARVVGVQRQVGGARLRAPRAGRPPGPPSAAAPPPPTRLRGRRRARPAAPASRFGARVELRRRSACSPSNDHGGRVRRPRAPAARTAPAEVVPAPCAAVSFHSPTTSSRSPLVEHVERRATGRPGSATTCAQQPHVPCAARAARPCRGRTGRCRTRAAPGDAVAVALLDEVEAGRTSRCSWPCGPAAAPTAPGRSEPALAGVLEGDHHLEQRVPGQCAVRVERLHQPLERQVLVVVGGEVGLPHPAPAARAKRGRRTGRCAAPGC